MNILFSLILGVFAHSDELPTTLHTQMTAVSQDHGPFTSPYQGQNSLQPIHESATSVTWTIFGGVRLFPGLEVYVNPELAGGTGLSHTEGIAGFPNGEIYRVDDPSPKWNLARLFVKQTFGWGEDSEIFQDGKNQIADKEKVRRITVVLGKFALNDYFDNNTFSHDPRTQFLNWAFMDNAAWDYAADTRGYSWGAYLELNQAHWTLRWATVMVPLKANQMEMDKDFPVQRGDNLEYEYRYALGERAGTARLLAYQNIANMGNYRETIDTPAAGMDITHTRGRSRKYGFGLNLEQEINANFGVFSRLGWNDGHTETWAFTEVDRTASLGGTWKGTTWKRSKDLTGIALVFNWLSDDHRDYLANGGYGFLIGDGRLSYAPEEIAEAFYLYHLNNGLETTLDYQFVQNPAYNSDRGPVSIIALRLHLEI